VVRDSVDFPLRGSNIKREFHFDTDLWPAKVDADQLSQVIQNLGINAGHAMPDGGCLQISVQNITLSDNDHSGLKPGCYLLITFSDEGHGIPRRDQEKIFDPYFSSKETGSGLGLAVAYAIMKKHDGLITVDSVPGMGATFSLYLPASCERQDLKDDRQQGVSVNEGHILIMDDEDMVREVAGEMLGYLGYTTISAHDGEETLKLYQEAMEEGNPFDAVLMDLTIPGGMGGKETMIKLLELDPDARGVASSGYANDPIMAHFADYGFSAVVPKPYRLEDLRASLNQVLPADR
jgi:CheY-like chemotaxis protein